jgi:hypothetical protein
VLQWFSSSWQRVLLDYLSGRVEGMEMPPMPRRDNFAALGAGVASKVGVQPERA